MLMPCGLEPSCDDLLPKPPNRPSPDGPEFRMVNTKRVFRPCRETYEYPLTIAVKTFSMARCGNNAVDPVSVPGCWGENRLLPAP